MNVDHLALITFVESNSPADDPGCIRPSQVMKELGWSQQRIDTCLKLLLEEGMIWVDSQTDETTYYLPSLALIGGQE